MGEVAVAQVLPQFFDGILNLNPGMVPGIGLIESFQISFMLCYFLRVTKGEGELMPLHGEDTAQTVGGGLQIRREVGGVCHQSDVTDLVLLGHDSHRDQTHGDLTLISPEDFYSLLREIFEHNCVPGAMLKIKE